MTEIETTARTIGERADVDWIDVWDMLVVVIPILMRWCLRTPERAAAWMNQNTPATRNIIGNRVNWNWKGSPETLPVVREAVLEECITITAGRIRNLFAEVNRAKEERQVGRSRDGGDQAG